MALSGVLLPSTAVAGEQLADAVPVVVLAAPKGFCLSLSGHQVTTCLWDSRAAAKHEAFV